MRAIRSRNAGAAMLNLKRRRLATPVSKSPRIDSAHAAIAMRKWKVAIRARSSLREAASAMYHPGHKKLTPVMEQYREAKRAFPDAILFFRLGDFYEMFNDDAVVAARELSLTLTSRNKGSPDQVPMAGVPYHAAHGYLTKLLKRG